MLNDNTEEAIVGVKQAIEEVLLEQGPHTPEEISKLLLDKELAYIEIMGEKYIIENKIVFTVLNLNSQFVQDASGRWHLGAEIVD